MTRVLDASAVLGGDHYAGRMLLLVPNDVGDDEAIVFPLGRQWCAASHGSDKVFAMCPSVEAALAAARLAEVTS